MEDGLEGILTVQGSPSTHPACLKSIERSQGSHPYGSAGSPKIQHRAQNAPITTTKIKNALTGKRPARYRGEVFVKPSAQRCWFAPEDLLRPTRSTTSALRRMPSFAVPRIAKRNPFGGAKSSVRQIVPEKAAVTCEDNLRWRSSGQSLRLHGGQSVKSAVDTSGFGTAG